jgi:hypothetical protein
MSGQATALNPLSDSGLVFQLFFSSQLPFGLITKFLVLAFWLTRLPPKFVGAAGDFNFSWLCRWVLSAEVGTARPTRTRLCRHSFQGRVDRRTRKNIGRAIGPVTALLTPERD